MGYIPSCVDCLMHCLLGRPMGWITFFMGNAMGRFMGQVLCHRTTYTTIHRVPYDTMAWALPWVPFRLRSKTQPISHDWHSIRGDNLSSPIGCNMVYIPACDANSYYVERHRGFHELSHFSYGMDCALHSSQWVVARGVVNYGLRFMGHAT